MKCNCCGKEIDVLSINKFLRDGDDMFVNVPLTECDENAVFVDVNSDWSGYGLDEDDSDLLDTIRCPLCDGFPFKCKEVQVHEIVRVVCFKE